MAKKIVRPRSCAGVSLPSEAWAGRAGGKDLMKVVRSCSSLGGNGSVRIKTLANRGPHCISRLQIDELFIDTQPAHLQKNSQQKLNAEERDYLRAQIIRERLKVFPKPDISKMVKGSGNGLTDPPSTNE